MKKFHLFCYLVFSSSFCFAQSVGIGTTTPNPNALLHIDLATNTSKGLLVTGTYNGASTVPDLGAGSRMMFYPGKAAFRAGNVGGTHWNNMNVGLYSTAMGYNTTASGYTSTALGNGTIASGDYSVAIGNDVTASGYYSMAFGGLTAAIGDNSISLGTFSRSLGRYSMALGYLTVSNGSYSTSMGHTTNAKGYSSTVLGMYNDSILLTDQTAIEPETPLFIIGNGNSSSLRSNAMVVRKDGNIGMGTNIPSARLHLKSNSLGNATNSQLMLEEDGDDYTRITMKNTATPSRYWDMGAYSHATNSSARLSFYYQGVGDILYLKGDGNATLMGLLAQSDSRLKTNILPIASSLSHVMQLNGYQYTWKDKNRDQDLQLGMLAQEVEKTFPQLVRKDDKGVLSVNYLGFVPVLITAMKEQQLQITTQQEQINRLEQRLNAMDKKNE